MREAKLNVQDRVESMVQILLLPKSQPQVRSSAMLALSSGENANPFDIKNWDQILLKVMGMKGEFESQLTAGKLGHKGLDSSARMIARGLEWPHKDVVLTVSGWSLFLIPWFLISGADRAVLLYATTIVLIHWLRMWRLWREIPGYRMTLALLRERRGPT